MASGVAGTDSKRIGPRRCVALCEVSLDDTLMIGKKQDSRTFSNFLRFFGRFSEFSQRRFGVAQYDEVAKRSLGTRVYPEGVLQRSPGLHGLPGNPGLRSKIANNPDGVAQMVATLRNPFRVLALDGDCSQGSPPSSGNPGLRCVTLSA